MSAAFTPGPWEANRWTDEDADIYGWSFSAGGYLLPLSDMETDDPAICDANAKLIAAAPDLLHALTFVLKGMDAGHIKCAPYIDFDPNAAQLEFKSPAQMLREVLAKATGEQP